MTEQTSEAVETPLESAPIQSPDANPESSQEGEAPFVAKEDITENVQKRINKLTYERHEAERKFEELNGRFADLEQKINSSPKQPEKQLSLEDFDYDNDKFTAALIDQRASQLVDQKLNERETVQTQTQQKQEKALKTQKFVQSFDAYAESNPEVLELANQMPGVITSQTMQDFLIGSDLGPQVQHALMKNYSELTRIQSLDPMMQAAELGKLEYKLSLPPAKKLSEAPDPVEPLGGGADVSTSTGTPIPKMPF